MCKVLSINYTPVHFQLKCVFKDSSIGGCLSAWLFMFKVLGINSMTQKSCSRDLVIIGFNFKSPKNVIIDSPLIVTSKLINHSQCNKHNLDDRHVEKVVVSPGMLHDAQIDDQ